MIANNRGLTLFTALIAGFLVGALLSALVLYAVLPVETLVSSIAPSFLTRATGPAVPGYREFYVAGVANRYKDRLNRGVSGADALSIARNQLGVESGDATPLQAAQMARTALDVATAENGKDADLGWFTVADQNNLTELATRLEAEQGAAPKTSSYEESRKTLRLLGGAALLLLLGLTGFLLYWLTSSEGRMAVAADGAVQTSGLGTIAQQVIRAAPFSRPAQPAQPAQNVVVVQQPPLVVQQPMQPMQQAVMAAADPNATGHMQVAPTNGETFLTTFDPTSYHYGDDSYEESFTIVGATGEYLGECGVSIADRLDLATPAKVCALGVWVFDKNDPQFKSVMKVLMTPNAYNDPIIRNKLNRLGEHVLAQNGMFDIATETMRVEATISDLAVNPAGYFDNVNLAFNVHRKGA